MEEKKVRSRTTSNQTGVRQVRSRSLQQERKNTNNRNTAGRSATSRTTENRPARRSQSKRRRKRNLIIKMMLLVLFVVIALAGAVLWMNTGGKYGGDAFKNSVGLNGVGERSECIGILAASDF